MPSFFAFIECRRHRTGTAALLLAALLMASAARAQAPAWAWAEAINQSAVSAGVVQATATDAAGNVYLAGNFVDVAVFGTTTLTSAGSTDAFVAKYDPVGRRYLWAVRMGGASGETATALAVSGTSVYVAGNFGSATVGFGSTTLTNVSAGGGNDGFVAKLTDMGSSASFGWALGLGGTGDDAATAVLVQASDVYVAGSFQNALVFGATTLRATGISRDGFVVNLTDAGTSSVPGWGTQVGGAEDDVISALAFGNRGMYLAGTFGGSTASFGLLTLTNAGGFGTTDAFVACLLPVSSRLVFVWAERAGGIRDDAAYALATSGTAVYVGGSFTSPTATFGSFALPNADASGSTPNADGFVARLTDAGTSTSFAWATATGGLGTDEIQALAVRGSAVYAGGYFDGTTTSFGSHVLTAAGTFRNEEITIARLQDNNTSAAWVWAQRAGGVGDDRTQSLSLVGSQVLVGGYITPPGSFGSTTFAGPTGTLAGTLASLTDPLLGTATPSLSPSVMLSPNPAHGVVAVRLAAAGAEARVLELLDALGRPVRRVVLPAGAVEGRVDVRGLCPGLYVLRGEGVSGKVLVE